MKQKIIFLVFGFLLLVSCRENWVGKPKGLISQKKMVSILVDLHVADAVFQNKGNAGPLEKLKSEDIYYSVLKKYNVADTIFEKSFIYYSYFPKEFEKIYANVLDRVNQMQEKVNPREKKELDVGNKANPQ
jgi:hypothetical protein